MKLHRAIKSYTAVTLLFILTIIVESAHVNKTSSDDKPPSHLSWTSNFTRYDLVFNTENPIKNLVKLESDANNFLTSSLSKCTNHSACLFMNGTYLESFHVNNTISHESIFTPLQSGKINVTSQRTQCDNGNKFKIFHYCSTHWNAPVYLSRSKCRHTIEWHSPLRCHSNSTNHEHPCYTYDQSGKLIDLTPWILSNGSSHLVDTSGTSLEIKDFHVNICNEATEACGPNVSSCYTDEQHGQIESGYNNLTSIKFDQKDNAVLLTSLGHFKQQCEGARIKTVIRFTCKNKSTSQTGPKLVRTDACENVIDWPTVRACPVADITQEATSCSIKYDTLGVNIDINKLTGNRDVIEVPNIDLDGKHMKMILGICQGLPKTLECEGRFISTTQACLIDANDNSTTRTEENSLVVGSIAKSFIRLSDERIYLESFALNKTCHEPVRDGFNVTQQVGTRIEFHCSVRRQDVPTFLGYDDCTYVFEWGTPSMCLESFTKPSNRTEKFDDTKSVILEDEVHLKNVDVKDVLKYDLQEKQITHQEKKSAKMITQNNPNPKMNTAHKYFMISLILVSFVAFIVVIFVLDKKTRLRVTLRQARQVFQPSHQQPYSRVINDLNL